jgi:RNA polymerase sigma-70 factor (ECF subfamily)
VADLDHWPSSDPIPRVVRNEIMYALCQPSQVRFLPDLCPPIADGGPRPRVGMMAGSDAETHAALIIAIARRQDRAAFRQLFLHFAPRLKTYLLRGGLETSIAEEMAQEVMLMVWHRAHQYDPARASAGAWIFGIASNLRIDAFRRNRLALPEDDASDASSEPLADALLGAEQTAQRVRDALATLPPDQLAALQLAFFEDLSHAEIQPILGIPLGTIKSRLRLALAKLRIVLKDCE